MFHHVLVAGIGTLGSEVVKNLGLLGCESVLLADADTIEEKNVTRSLLLRSGITGQHKVSHVLGQLQTWFPQTHWSAMPVEIADVESEQFSKADVLFSCVDTDLARVEIAALSARYKVPVCDGALGGTSTRVGRVSWFPAINSAACFACLLTSRRRAELFNICESDVHACWARESNRQSAWTSTSTMASIVAGLQIEVAHSAIGKAKEACSVHLDLDQAPISHTIQHRRSSGCPLHDEAFGLTFPVCTFAECDTCGTLFSPNRRIAWVRRWAVCPSCGSHALKIRDSLRDQLIGSAS